MNHPSSSSSATVISTSASEPSGRTGERPARVYEPPCIENDLPLEVMSLACTGYLPKQASPKPCYVLGS